tara:strand:- start:2227 stop:2988 length:762 start_codon:yes stop_codon:yes gene_type:complete
MEVHMKAIQDNFNFCENVKKENGELSDELDLKEEEIKDYIKQVKALHIQLAHKSNEVSGLHTNLSQDINGLRSKLINRDNRIEELETQINQTKIGYLDDLQNKLHVANQKLKEYEAVKPETRCISTQSDEATKPPKKITTPEQRKTNFMIFIRNHYDFNYIANLNDRCMATMPFSEIKKKLNSVSGPKGKKDFTMRGDYAHFPNYETQVAILKEMSVEKYGDKYEWKCSLKGQKFNGSSDKLDNHFFDLKVKV